MVVHLTAGIGSDDSASVELEDWLVGLDRYRNWAAVDSGLKSLNALNLDVSVVCNIEDSLAGVVLAGAVHCSVRIVGLKLHHVGLSILEGKSFITTVAAIVSSVAVDELLLR